MARALRTTRSLEFQAHDDTWTRQEFPEGTACTRVHYHQFTGDVLRHMDDSGRDWLLTDAHYDDWEVI